LKKRKNKTMTAADLLDVSRDGIVTFLKVGAPLMLVALAVGLVISLIQALTQIQEQTLIFVPKIVAVFGAMLLMLPFMGDAMAGYMSRIAARIASGG
jgi:flagellar biosynthesis protein FliQ